MTKKEEFRVSGEQVVQKVKDLVKEGNIRSITIKNKGGKVVATFPLTVGVIGTLLLPILAAIGAIAAVVTECTIVVERDDE